MTIGNAVALAAERILDPIQGMHTGISDSWFRAVGPLSGPVRLATSGITAGIYASLRLSAVVVGLGLDARVPRDSPTADAATAFVTGVWGDHLGHRKDGLGIEMGIRDVKGAPVSHDATFPAAFPAATSRIVVLVHGLTKTERCWQGANDSPGLLGALEEHDALTPVTVRYNTGLAIRDNGEKLAALLEETHRLWPVPIESMTLVGHSMGGLVIRSACGSAVRGSLRWLDDVTDVITIASPHRGAPLEKLAHLAARGLGMTDRTRPLAEFLDGRSQGIKDLRLGDIGVDPREAAGISTRLSRIRHHVIAGVVTTDPSHPLGAVVGDLMVRPTSGTNPPDVTPVDVAVLGGVNHANLLNDRAVISHLMERITQDLPLPAR
ncbi:MAG TPA: hypothetical protein VLA29_01705 [Acidimicrobiia bacterium]|nr:hypothetical protein [Acidimicrobiia bacterium]